MKRHLATLVVTHALVAAHCFAREPQPPPSPSVDGASAQVGTIKKLADSSREEISIYVGHYGEVIEFPYGWTAEGELRGATEAVYLHRKSHDQFGYKPFNPKPADYKLENFAPMGLMELVVIPKNAPGGMRSLKAIRRAKEKELTQNGVDYDIFEETSDTHWPWGTFHVKTKLPYRIEQTYAASPKEFYILTVGGALEESAFGLSRERVLEYYHANDLVSRSLGKHLLAVHKKSIGETLFRFQTETPGDLFSEFKMFLRTKDTLKERKLIQLVEAYKTGDEKKFLQLESGEFSEESALPQKILGALSGVMLILALWPGTSARVRRARLLGRSLLIFTFLTGLAGFLVVYIPARFGNAVWNSDELALLIPVLFIPWISWFAARRFGSAHTKRVLGSTGGLAALWTTLMLWDANLNNTDPPSIMAFENTQLLLVVGLMFGLAFALAFGPLPKKEGKQ